MDYHFGMDGSYGSGDLDAAFSLWSCTESGGYICWSTSPLLMCFSPIRPDLVFPGRRAPHPEMTPRKLDGFHKEFAEGVGFFRGGVELRFILFCILPSPGVSDYLITGKQKGLCLALRESGGVSPSGPYAVSS